MPSTIQRMTAICISAAILVGGAFAASHVPTVIAEETATTRNSLEVTVNGVRNSEGKIVVLVLDNPQAYNTQDYDKAVGYQEIPASTGSVQAVFPELLEGPYAVVAFHDENGNRDLDIEGQIPSEGYTVSGARDAYDEPPFQRAASVEPARTVKLFYLD